MSKRVEITLEFVRSEKSSDPYSFQFGVQKYLCRDAKRHEYDELVLDWDDHLLGLLEQLQRAGVSAEVMAELGQRLTNFLAPAGIRAHEDRIVEAIGRGESVDVVLSSSAAELYSLPWELLRLRSTGQLLGEVPNCLIRHVWPGVKDEVPPTRTGRLLVGWSAAGGPVPSRAHVAGIGHAPGGHLEFDPDRDVVADISLRTLDQRLASLRDEVRALHILCHGGADGLAFDAVDGMGKVVVDARTLQTLLAPYANSLSLVVICACHGGDGGALGTRLGSAAQALHRAGVDAVVASRFPLSTTGSITLAETLYTELARNGGDVRGAFLRAKRALALDSGHVDHVSIQLYAHENALHWDDGGSVSELRRLERWHAEQAATVARKLGGGEVATASASSSAAEPSRPSGAGRTPTRAPAAIDSDIAIAPPVPSTRAPVIALEPTLVAASPKRGGSIAAKVGGAVAALAACVGLVVALSNSGTEPPPTSEPAAAKTDAPATSPPASDEETPAALDPAPAATDPTPATSSATAAPAPPDPEIEKKATKTRTKTTSKPPAGKLPPFDGALKSQLQCGGGDYALRDDGHIFEVRGGVWVDVGNSAKSITCVDSKVICHSFNDSKWSYQGSPHQWAEFAPAPASEPAPKKRDLGCFIDTQERMLSGIGPIGITPANNSIDGCVEACRKANARYAGVQNAGDCWCGNTLKKEGHDAAPDSECNKPCLGKPSELCGGEWRIRVYSTGI
ncbi:MAG: WSC domain-containing protein [Nannocystaceae bacterium]